MIVLFFRKHFLTLFHLPFGGALLANFKVKDFESPIFDWKVFEFDKLVFY